MPLDGLSSVDLRGEQGLAPGHIQTMTQRRNHHLVNYPVLPLQILDCQTVLPLVSRNVVHEFQAGTDQVEQFRTGFRCSGQSAQQQACGQQDAPETRFRPARTATAVNHATCS